VDTLDRIARQDDIRHVIVAGDDVVVPLLREQMPQHLVEKLVDVLKLERNAGEDQIVEATLHALRQKEAENDAERVQEVVDACQSGGLGVVGPEAVLSALQLGQVDELFITATPQELKSVQTLPADAAPDSCRHLDVCAGAGGQGSGAPRGRTGHASRADRGERVHHRGSGTAQAIRRCRSGAALSPLTVRFPLTCMRRCHEP
jgi:Bacterial archaeo-eukaryotic release factor family 10